MKKLFVLLTLFALSACSTAKVPDVASLSGMLVADSELFYDFGDLNIEGGLVDHSFSFTNDGEEDLVLMNLSTSCMCTEAEVVLPDGTKSPVFGMRSSTEWSYAVPAGESFEVLVIYDPMAHGPNATGEINRSVMMVTSSKENGRTAVIDPSTGYAFSQMNIKGMVLSAEDYLESNSETNEI